MVESVNIPIKKRNPIVAFLLLPSKMMYFLYRWTIRWARTKYAKASLFIIAFAESSFFPVPPDVLLIAMTVAHRYKWWLYALIATAGSVFGALFGYYIGYALFEGIGKPIVDFYQLDSHFQFVGQRYSENAFLAIFTAAFTPIPFKVFTLAAGAFKVSLIDLILASLFGRAARFFAVAFALRLFGKRVEDTIEKYFNILSIAFIVLLIGGFLIIRLF